MASGVNIESFIEEHRASFLLAFLGIFFLGIGVLSAVILSLNQRKPQVEILSSQEAEPQTTQQITVDVAGAVKQPGIYELTTDSRVNDALKAAGGLTDEADAEWLSKYINLAQILPDGVKIYVPSVGENPSAAEKESVSAGQEGIVIGTTDGAKINVNTASVSELETLWGIGEKRAADIIANRPYSDLTELMDKASIPKNVFEEIKDEVSLF